MGKGIRNAYELGGRSSRREVGTWVAIAALCATCVTASVLALAIWPGATGSRFVEALVPTADWAIRWTDKMEPPSIEQAAQTEALRYVVGGGLALLAGLCFLVIAALWGQRLRLRRTEHFTHWAVGADRWHVLARLVGEARLSILATVAAAIVAVALIVGVMLRTFPGEIEVSVEVRAGLIVWTALVTALARWERLAAAGPVRGSRFQAHELLGSPTAVGAVGVAVLVGVGLLVLHAPYAFPTSSDDEIVVDVSLTASSDDGRRAQLASLIRGLSADGERLGVAARGAVRGTGYRDTASTECGECSEGGIYMPVKTVRAEVFSVAQDTFALLGVQVTRGRDFDDVLDSGSPNAAIVSEALAGRHFERGQAIGKRIRVGHGDWLTVVGVVSDAPDVSTPTEYAIYLPVTQLAPAELELIVPRPGDMDAVVSRVASTGAVSTGSHDRALAFVVHRWFRGLMWAVGLGAMVALAFGLWVAAANEARATGFEIALRRAVGARQRDLGRLYAGLLARRLSRAMVLGAWLSLFLGAGLARAYGGIPQVDPLVLAAAGVWVSLFYVLGSWGPFLRACRAPLVRGMSGDAV